MVQPTAINKNPPIVTRDNHPFLDGIVSVLSVYARARFDERFMPSVRDVARRRRQASSSRRRRRNVHRKDECERTHRDRDRDARDARDASRDADGADIVVGGDAVCSRVDDAECARRWRVCARGWTSECV